MSTSNSRPNPPTPRHGSGGMKFYTEEPPAISTRPPECADARLAEVMDRHPTALGRHLDSYLGAVARELETRGVLTGRPQRTDPAQRLLGSIVLDCTALRIAAWPPRADQPAHQQSVGAALHPERPAPTILSWDEVTGWCAGCKRSRPVLAALPAPRPAPCRRHRRRLRRRSRPGPTSRLRPSHQHRRHGHPSAAAPDPMIRP